MSLKKGREIESLFGKDLVVSIPFLHPEEIERALRGVLSLREHWVQRHWITAMKPPPFFTLGAAAYADAPRGVDVKPESNEYYRRAGLFNPILRREFAWLYDKIASKVGELLEARAEYDANKGLPGMHIFLPHASFSQLKNYHFDLQFMDLHWSAPFDWRKSFTFTVPISLPNAGAGLEIVRTHYADCVGMPQKAVLEKYLTPSLGEGLVTIMYDPGHFIVHPGLYLHRFAPIEFHMGGKKSDTLRVTLQGHALWIEDRWILYW